MRSDLGFAGNLARMFVKSKLTPVIAVMSVLLGLVAVVLTPKEEEPQISVPMVDIQVSVPGFEAEEVERRVTEVVERAVWGLEGVEYVYASSRAHGSLVTVRFKVGEPLEPSLVKIHHKLMALRGDLPPNASAPMVKSFSIDDVPFLVLTFSSDKRDDYDLRQKVAPLARELSSTPDLSRVELVGGLKRSLRVVVDPARLAARGASLEDVARALSSNDVRLPAGKDWSVGEVHDIEVGGRLTGAHDIEALSVGQRGGSNVRIRDVARVSDGPEERTRASRILGRDGRVENAVSIVFAKRKGTNVVDLADKLTRRAAVFSKDLPADVTLNEVRNYGHTAGEKTKELIEHLVLAVLSVSILIALVMGVRSSLVVAVAIPVTLALTLALYYFLGYTLNRVTLFALIFSIGILVDDAIVVVENIERHLHQDKPGGILKATLTAVAEVGNPTILATFTVIAAILPMAFVRGLMGPYMKPIPVGASLAMVLSLLVAFVVTPWAAVKLLKADGPSGGHGNGHREGRLDRLYRSIMERLLGRRREAMIFGAVSLFLLLASISPVLFKGVMVKMLPFDNKNEFQVLVDYPPTTSLKASLEMTTDLAQRILKDPDVLKVQVFAGEPAPFSFSGMVKHTFLRRSDELADLQVVLKEKGDRKRSSHDIIAELRPTVASFGKEKSAVTKVLEIPPGPPVLSTLVAEVYGPNAASRERAAREVEKVFAAEPSVVDLDVSWRPGRPRKVYAYDPIAGGSLGIGAQQVAGTGRHLFSETSVASLEDAESPEDVSIDLSVANDVRSGPHPFKDLILPSFEAGAVRAARVLKPTRSVESKTLYRKNLKPLDYVTAELAGAEEAPVYGLMKMEPRIPFPTQTADVPWDTQEPIVKWDGEWFITYEVFRDLGGAFAVVLVLIYVLVLGWFRSFAVPLVIMAPIPISLIGILPGHWALGAYFTATSMIGFIAGAGIIVRNSIILVDFIEQQLAAGVALKEAVISAGVLRFRPMLLTAAAVVVGSAVILFDPIFQGLAISLMFGEVAATLLSRLAVPVLYFWFIGRDRMKFLQEDAAAHHSLTGGTHVH